MNPRGNRHNMFTSQQAKRFLEYISNWVGLDGWMEASRMEMECCILIHDDRPRCRLFSLSSWKIDGVCVKEGDSGRLERASDPDAVAAISEAEAAALVNPGNSHKSCLFVSMMTDICR